MHILMAVPSVFFLTPALLGIILKLWLRIQQFYMEMHKYVQLQVEQLSSFMAQHLHTVKQGSQKQSEVSKGALLFAVLQHWQLWAFAGLLVLFAGLSFHLRNKRRKLGNYNKQESSPSEENKEAEDDSDSDEAYSLGSVWAVSTQWPSPYRAEMCQLVEEFVEDLLRACRGRARRSFTPRLQQAIGVACVYDGWSACEDNILYRLLVPLRPPPGHTFHLELGNEEEMRTKKSCVRVELECTCEREQLLGDMLCFVHHAKEELRKKQEPSLLDTLCQGSYLHMEETALWLQNQVKKAWRSLPQSRDCRLVVLPSTCSCKVKLTTSSNRTLSMELLLGLQLDDSDTFLSLE
ncbi:inositol 1,4,5-trisphosphate receptor-interacting protein-like 1 [Excalfactoria chinensis]|uniref:inositol 1,4,5-trisphosphate receptor-interacting protein-like 1 n=1 Tax=Excalfactoria chinensis TaxID=46218 RepID=UPI003B3B5AD6